MSEPHYVYFITDDSGKSVKVPPPPRQMSAETLVMVGVFTVIAAFIAGMIWLVVSIEADRHRQQVRCEQTGGVYINARDYHHCLYGVTRVK